MPRWLANLIGLNSASDSGEYSATAQSGIVGRFCETLMEWRLTQTPLHCDACQNLQRLRDILRNIELRCAFLVSQTGCVATRWI
jgi:hypothetical protein